MEIKAEYPLLGLGDCDVTLCDVTHCESNKHIMTSLSRDGRERTLGLFFMAYQNLVGRCLVCKHGSHVIKIPKADWSSVKNKKLTATPC